MDRKLEICLLQDCPHAVSTVFKWLYDQWGQVVGTNPLVRIAQFVQAGASDDDLPVTWVALDGEWVVGTASLAERDLETRPDLSPWLVSVYVNAADRRQGIGSALVRHVVEQARRRGVETLWLFTPDQAPFYRRLGWQPVERVPYRGEDVVVMKRQLSGHSW